MNKQNGKDGGETFIMEDIRYIAWNLGKTGMSAEKIAKVLETDIHTVALWLEEAGIAAAKEKGVRFGRSRVEPPDNFPEIVDALENKEITAKEAIRQSGLAEATFYRRLREYMEKRCKHN